MPDLSQDPVDHARTTRQHAGESMKNGVNAPGLIAVGVGVVALVAGLYAFASGHEIAGAVAVALAVLHSGAGVGWLAVAHRRVRETERRWHAEHPGEPYESPTS